MAVIVSKYCASHWDDAQPRAVSSAAPPCPEVPETSWAPLSLCGAAFETETDLATSAQGGRRLLAPGLLCPPPHSCLHAAGGTLHSPGDAPVSTVSHQAFLRGGLTALTHSLLSAPGNSQLPQLTCRLRSGFQRRQDEQEERSERQELHRCCGSRAGHSLQEEEMCCQCSAPDGTQWVPGHRQHTQTAAAALPAPSAGSLRRDSSAQLHFITAATICQVKSSDFLLWVELATGQALFSLANHAAGMFRQGLAA